MADTNRDTGAGHASSTCGTGGRITMRTLVRGIHAYMSGCFSRELRHGVV
jgi:hypothetical protein